MTTPLAWAIALLSIATMDAARVISGTGSTDVGAGTLGALFTFALIMLVATTVAEWADR